MTLTPPSATERSVWTTPLTWCVVIAAAMLLAVATLREPGVLGRLPDAVGQTLNNKPSAIAPGDARFLALVTFHRDQRKAADSWISGLQLHQDRSISWVRMPVLNDPGDAAQREAFERRLLARYTNEQERQHLVPVITDRAAFVRSVGLAGTGSAYVLVINRNGEVLARVVGEFDESKAETLRDTLFMREL